MKRLVLVFFVIIIVFFSIKANAEITKETQIELRESGVLLGAFIIALIGGVFLFFIIIAMVCGELEKKEKRTNSGKPPKKKRRRTTMPPKPPSPQLTPSTSPQRQRPY
jgi:hypothetical protein